MSRRFSTKKAHKRKIVFFSLIILFVFLGIGYANLSTFLKVDGTIQLSQAVPFSVDSWSTIVSNIQSGDTSRYNVGDTRKIDLGNLGIHTLRVINNSTPSECFNYDKSQTACGFVVEFADIITTQKMNNTATNSGGWSNSSLRTYLNNDFYNSLPADLKNIIVETKVLSGHESGTTSNYETTDKIFLLSNVELFGNNQTNDSITTSDTRQMDFYQNGGSVVKEYNNTNTNWWLRSANSNSSTAFWYENGSGDANNNYGVSPVFRLSNLAYEVHYSTNGGEIGEVTPVLGTEGIVLEVSKPRKSFRVNIDANSAGASITSNGDTVESVEEEQIFLGWTATNFDTVKARYGTSIDNVNNPWDGVTKIGADTNSIFLKDLQSIDSEASLIANWEEEDITLPKVEKTGCICNYNTEPDGSGECFNSEESYPSDIETSSTTLYVQCTPNNYSIEYALNGGNNPSTKPISGTYDENVTISKPTKTVTVTGNANGTGATIGSATSSVQTFAGWTASGLDTTTAKYGTSASTVTTAWNGTTKVGASNDPMYFRNLRSDDGTVTLTANWTPVSVTLPTLSKTGYTCKWYDAETDGNEMGAGGASWTPSGTSSASVTAYARCTINNPTTPTISGGATKIYGSSDTTLTCATTTTYASGASIYYSFGYATSDGGTPSNWTTSSTTATYKVSKTAYVGDRYYSCRVYATDGTQTSTTIASETSADTLMRINNATLTFDATTNGGTLNGTGTLYARSGQTAVYTSIQGSTEGTIPTASKLGFTFKGWYDAATGGNKVLNADGTFTGVAVSGYTTTAAWIVETNKTLYAQYSIDNPEVPTISGGTTRIYNYSSRNLTCETASSYVEGTNIYYEFGYATSTTNFTNGTIEWLGSPSTTATYNVASNVYRGSRYYTCRVYAKNGEDTSEIVQGTTTTTMSYVNARLYFDAATNGGTSTAANRYVSYQQTNIYTGRTNTTAGTIPTANKTGYTFTGWYTAPTDGDMIINASGEVQANVSGWTNSSKQWIRTASGNNDTSNVLYAQFTPNTYTIGYTLNGGDNPSTKPTSGTYDENVTISKPTKTFTVNIEDNSQNASIKLGNDTVTSASSAQTFAGWTATNLDTTTSMYGTASNAVTTPWDGTTKIGANNNSMYFKNLTSTKNATVTMIANWTAVAVTLPTITKTGYTCSFNTESDGSGTSYASAGSYTPSATSSSTTLFVRCSANSYTISYEMNGGTQGSNKPTSGTYDSTVTIDKPTKTFTVNIKDNSQGATVKLGNNTVTSASSTQTFAGWTATSLDTTNARYGTESNSVTTTWNGTTKIGASNNTLYFKNLRSTSGTVTLTANWTAVNVTLPTATKNGYTCHFNTANNDSGTSYASGADYTPSTATNSVDLYVICVDDINPSANITSTSTLKSTSQTLTLKCSDTVGITGYYYGTSAPTSSTTYTTTASDLTAITGSGLTKNATGKGTYYLSCKDNAGNKDTQSITLHSYKVVNMLQNTTGSTYTTTHYTKASESTYIAPKGTNITLTSVYTIPTGSSSERFDGYSSGDASTTAVTPSKTAPTLNSDSTYTMWFTRNVMSVRYKTNGGTVQATTHTADNATTYTWGIDSNGYITKNNSNNFTSWRYGTETMDLYNYNNKEAMFIYKIGYTHTNGQEWICESGCVTENQVMNMNNNTSIVCDASTSDCIAVVKVNWKERNYSLTYELNSGTVSTDNPTTYKVTSSNITLNNPTKNGYTFSGWTEQIKSLAWYTGFINLSSGIIETNSSYTDSTYTDMILLKSGVTYTLSGYDTYSGIRWRAYDLNETYIGSVSSNNSYTPTSDCYVRILFYEASTSEQRSGTIISSSQGTSLVIPQGSTHNRKYIANYTANSYTVSFNANGGSGGQTANVSATYNAAMPTISTTAPTKTGYTFAGWYDATSGGTKYYNADGTSAKSYDKTSGTTLYAQWTANNYTIGYALNGGNNPSTKPTSGTYDENVTISKPSKTFTVNIDANSQGATVKLGDTAVTSASSSQTFAGWTATNLDTANAKYGTSASTVTTAWNGTTKVGASNDPMYFKNLRSTSGTVTLTANWTAVNVTLPTVTKTGYTCGYATSSTGAIEYASGASYPASTTGNNSTIYVICTPNDYTITYDYRNTALSTLNSAGEFEDTGYIIDWDKDFTITGVYRPATSARRYLVIGNYNDGAKTLNIEITTANKFRVYMGSGTVDDVSETTIGTLNKEITYTFTWTASTKTYTLTATESTNTNISMTGIYSGASGVATKTLRVGKVDYRDDTTVFNATSYTKNLKITKVYTYGNTLNNPDPVTRRGYAWNGWYTATSGGTEVTNSTSVPASNTTYYGRWTGNTWYVKFNANGGSGTMSNETMTFGSSKALTQNAFTRANYEFISWNTNTSGNGTVYYDKQSVSNLSEEANGIFNIYAMWRPTNYTVAFAGNGNTSGTMSNQTINYGTSTALTSNGYSKTGYTFSKWTNGSDNYNNSASVTINPNLLYNTSSPTVNTSTNGMAGYWRKNSTSATAVAITDSPSPDIAKYINIPANTSTSTRYVDHNNIPIASGQTYTISVWAKGTGSFIMRVGNGSPYKEATYTLTNTWTRYTLTFNAVSGSTAGTDNARSSNERTNVFFGTPAGNGAVQFCGMKMEKGSSATPYIDTSVANTYTVTANWTPNNYTIGYTLNGGNDPSTKPTSGTYDANVQISNPTKTITVTPNVNGTSATVGSATSKNQTFAGWTATGLNTSTAKYGLTPTTVTNTWNGTTPVRGYLNTFETDSWETIIANVQAGRYYAVGSTKQVDLGSLGTQTLRVANVSRPAECDTAGFSQTACGFVLEFKDVISTHAMNNTLTNAGSWAVSEMRRYLNDVEDSTSIINSLPSVIKNAIIDTTVVSGHGNTSGETNCTSTDKLYLLSSHEVYEDTLGTSGYDTSYDNTRQLDYYLDLGETSTSYSGAIKQYNNSDYYWWLRSARINDKYRFNCINCFGGINHYDATNSNGVSPAFRLDAGSSINVDVYFKNLRDTSGTVNLTANWDEVQITLPQLTSPKGYTCKYYTEASGGTEMGSGGQLWTPSSTNATDIPAYVRCTPNTYTINYTMNGGTQGSNKPTSGTYDANVTISKPTKTFTVNIDANSQGATISSLTATKAQTFAGWTASGLDTATAKYGTSTSAVTTAWSSGSTKVGASNDPMYFKNLRSTSGTVTLTANWTAVAVTLPTITKDGFTCGYATSASGSISYNSGGSYTPSTTTASTILYARCTIQDPQTPTISGGATKIYGSSATTLTCSEGTTYASGVSKYYSFGYATSDGGTPSNWTTASTAATLSISSTAYVGDRYYSCRVYATDGVKTSSTVTSLKTADTLMRINNATITFNANGGTLNGTSPLYAKSGQSVIYTTIRGTTSGTIPTATSTAGVFDGWYTAASGGDKVLNADGSFTGTAVSGYTTATAWATTDNQTLYAHYKEVKAENLSYDNTDTGVVCTDAQCMLECIDKKLIYGPSYICKEPILSSERFANDSWETIVENVQAGRVYEVGATKTINLGYSLGTHTLRVANNTTPEECENENFSETACGFVLEFTDYVTVRRHRTTATNVGGWPNSDIRTYVNGTVYNAFPEPVKSAILDTRVISGHGTTSGETNFTSTDKVYLLSIIEIYGSLPNSSYDTLKDDQTRQLDYYKEHGVTNTDNLSVVSKSNSSGTFPWLLRSVMFNNWWWLITDGGSMQADSNGYPVSPSFRIG